MTARTRTVRTTAKPRIGKFVVLGALIFSIALSIAFVSAGISLAREWLQDLPDYQDSDAYLLAEPTKVYDADNNLIAEFYLENRTPITIDQVSKYVLQGTVDTEDVRFYQHSGVDLQGILRAVVVQFTGGSEGASTITQQVVRNTVLKDERFEKTLRRKVREAYIAVQLEKIFSKDEILMMYLNTIYYGAGCYGIEAASQTYFGKTTADLTLNEAATLAGLPQSPTSYDPTVNPDAALERRNMVLERMLAAGDITEEQYDQTLAEPLQIHYTPRESSGAYAYPYFVDYVKTQLDSMFSTDIIFKGGLSVYTTIDPRLQGDAEDAVNSVIGLADDGLEGSLVSIDPYTGYIKAMVGGSDYSVSQYNLATSASRQPGSAFKTFTLTAAIQAGMSPDILVNSNSGITVGDWVVNNIDHGNWGIITLRQATYWSSNTAYAQVIHEITPTAVIDVAHAMGITSPLENLDSLTLGVDGCTVLEMASAYGTLAAGGVHYQPTAVTEVDDRNGAALYTASSEGTQAVSDSVAAAVTDVLQGVVSQGTASEAQLSVSQPVAGKTGTTDSNRDLWFVGYSPQLATAVWCGYRDQEQAIYYQGYSGSTGRLPSPIFSRFMSAALDGLPRAEFPRATPPVYLPNSSWSIAQTIVVPTPEPDTSTQTQTQQATTTETTVTTDGGSTENYVDESQPESTPEVASQGDGGGADASTVTEPAG